MEKRISKWGKFKQEVQSIWEGNVLEPGAPLSKLHKFAHFWVLVWTSFTRNRCPVRASGLAYASLLALIPMLAVAMSVTGSLLTKKGEDRISDFVFTFVASIIPPGTLSDDGPAATTPGPDQTNGASPEVTTDQPTDTSVVPTNTASRVGTPPPPGSQEHRELKARKEIADKIHQFVKNTRTGTLGVTGGIVLIFAAIGMLTRIEDTLNDIWGVQRGRSWMMRIILYWGVITLVPMLLVGALGLASGPHLETTRALISTAPWIGHLVFQMVPVILLCLTFAAFYMLMPNTKVHWQAALIGGLLGGLLFHLNNVISVFYVSQVVSYSKVYGSLGLVPVFIVGLYLSWLILLFGAQVAYAFQNRASYLEQKQLELINQRGREFIALRLITCIGQRFIRGGSPPKVMEISQQLSVPTRLIEQTVHTLCAARLVVEASGPDPAFVPARPLDQITCHDVLLAMRALPGKEPTTKDASAGSEVFGEFSRIEAAERDAASSITILALATRTTRRELTEGAAE